MKIYSLNKAVLSLRNNAVEFLNGLTSNAMDKPWNAFVDVHGMIIATFDQIVLNDDEVWGIVEKFCVDDVFKHLEHYAKLSGVKMERKEQVQVYFDLAGDYRPGHGEWAIPQKKGQLILTTRDFDASVSPQEFTLFRVRNAIPIHGVDYKDDFLLNVSEQDFVSFTKGCFLGQEPISKVHSRSKPTWRLVVKVEDECSDDEKAKMTSKVEDPATGRMMGFVFERNL